MRDLQLEKAYTTLHEDDDAIRLSKEEYRALYTIAMYANMIIGLKVPENQEEVKVKIAQAIEDYKAIKPDAIL